MTEALRIAVAGLGTVGAGTVDLLTRQAQLLASRGRRPLRITAVSARDRGRDRGIDVSALPWYDDAVAMAHEAPADVVVELIGGTDGPALAVCEAAIGAGRHVVTANKALLAHHGTALARAAEAAGVSLSFEAAVAGGIPIVKALREGLSANRIRRIYGILNGTCNYLLTGDARDRPVVRRPAGRSASARLCRGRSVDRRGRHRHRAQTRFGREPGLRLRGRFPGCLCRGHSPHVAARHRVRRGTRLPHQTAWQRARHRRRAGAAGPPLHGPPRHADRPCRGRPERRRRVRRLRRGHDLWWPRRRCRADRVRRRRRFGRYRRRPPDTDVRRARGRADRAAAGAHGAPRRRILYSPQREGPARRHRRHRRCVP